jgi:serine/threonine protein kinase
MKEPEALRVIEEIAKGCEYLYRKGIFHRDIKTENILLSENSNNKSISDVVKISDFGFAKMMVDQEMKDNPTDGTSVGKKYLK